MIQIQSQCRTIGIGIIDRIGRIGWIGIIIIIITITITKVTTTTRSETKTRIDRDGVLNLIKFINNQVQTQTQVQVQIQITAITDYLWR